MHLSLRTSLFAVALLLAAAGLAAAAESLPAEIDRCPFTNRFPVEVRLETAAELRMLTDWRVDIDCVRGLTATVYVDDAQLADLRAAGFRAEPVPNTARRAWAAEPRDGREAYHTYTTLTTELQQIAADHPAIVQLVSIGTSVQGRELWMMKISDNVTLDEPEPEFKYSATIHGNEPVGMEMCVYLIRLLTDSYGTDPVLTALVDDLEIFICPLHNPDGNANGTRYNAEGFDLNRSFPDPVDDPINDPTGRPTEVRHMMNFQSAHNVVLGSNFHTGALVVNYPWDSMYGEYTPDDTMVRNFALGYAIPQPADVEQPGVPPRRHYRLGLVRRSWRFAGLGLLLAQRDQLHHRADEHLLARLRPARAALGREQGRDALAHGPGARRRRGLRHERRRRDAAQGDGRRARDRQAGLGRADAGLLSPAARAGNLHDPVLARSDSCPRWSRM